MINGDLLEHRGDPLDLVDWIIRKIKYYVMFSLSMVGKASRKVQKCKKKKMYGRTQACQILIV